MLWLARATLLIVVFGVLGFARLSWVERQADLRHAHEEIAYFYGVFTGISPSEFLAHKCGFDSGHCQRIVRRNMVDIKQWILTLDTDRDIVNAGRCLKQNRKDPYWYTQRLLDCLGTQ